MSYKINWKKIKNGYKGFESLAVKYVQQEIEKNFKQTAETRDGNKDAVYKKMNIRSFLVISRALILCKNGGWKPNIAIQKHVSLAIN